ncbi:MAG TPA: AMP-binding protein [Blastocatellia bacterium]|nr:AMP-binding protein [Blastocatellia bacterium]
MDPVDPTPRLERFDSYDLACREFRWLIPQRINIATAICRRHTDAVTRIALSDVKEGGINTYTFGGLDYLSDKFATALSESGISRGDSVAVVLPPSSALAIAHLGALKTGAVVIPLSIASNVALLEYALVDSGARALVVDESIYGKVETVGRNLPNPKSRFVVRDLRPTVAPPDSKDFWSEVDRSSSDFDAVETDAIANTFIFYVETQGEITGVVHSHRSIIGQLTAFEMFNNVEREADSVFWTAGEWCSPGAVLGLLYPAWWYGCSLVAGTSEDAASALRLMEQCDVTHAFIASGQLEALAESESQPGEHFNLKVRTVVAEASRWPEYFVNSDPNVTLSEVYGRPETGWIVGGCERWFATTAGSVGLPVPGRSVEIIGESGNVLPPGHAGHIAVHKSDPGLFTGYHGAATRTAAAFIGDWFPTGDVGYKNGDGDLYIEPSPTVGGQTKKQ